MKKQMEFNSHYIEIVEELAKLKKALYIDKVEDVGELMCQVREVQALLESFSTSYCLDHFYYIVDFYSLLELGAYDAEGTLLSLSGCEYDAGSYFLIDDIYDEITVVDTTTIEDVYDELADQLIWLVVENIENIEELEEGHTLTLEGLELSTTVLEDGGWYNLTFPNGSILQNDTPDCLKFNSPLFSALILHYQAKF